MEDSADEAGGEADDVGDGKEKMSKKQKKKEAKKAKSREAAKLKLE